MTMSLEDFSDLVVAPFLQFAQRGLQSLGLQLRLDLALHAAELKGIVRREAGCLRFCSLLQENE